MSNCFMHLTKHALSRSPGSASLIQIQGGFLYVWTPGGPVHKVTLRFLTQVSSPSSALSDLMHLPPRALGGAGGLLYLALPKYSNYAALPLQLLPS